jgi:hypothetical protein
MIVPCARNFTDEEIAISLRYTKYAEDINQYEIDMEECETSTDEECDNFYLIRSNYTAIVKEFEEYKKLSPYPNLAKLDEEGYCVICRCRKCLNIRDKILTDNYLPDILGDEHIDNFLSSLSDVKSNEIKDLIDLRMKNNGKYKIILDNLAEYQQDLIPDNEYDNEYDNDYDNDYDYDNEYNNDEYCSNLDLNFKSEIKTGAWIIFEYNDIKSYGLIIDNDLSIFIPNEDRVIKNIYHIIACVCPDENIREKLMKEIRNKK